MEYSKEDLMEAKKQIWGVGENMGTEESKKIWEENAQFWDNAMGDESNEFHREVVRPKVTELLSPNPADYILDIACGNGNYSSYLAQRGASVVAFDYSKKMIELAKRRQSQYAKQIEFCVADATDRKSILELKRNRAFTKAVSNMAIMDITDIEPLLMAVYELLQESGIFVFATQHPCFVTLTEKYMTPHSYYDIHLQEEHYQALINAHDQIRGIRHDMKNHLEAISILAGQHKDEEILRYLNDIVNQIEVSDNTIFTGNSGIDAILNLKLSEAIRKGISISKSILVPRDLSIPFSDSVVILGNIFDNAIEACGRDHIKEPLIYFKMQYVDSMLFIEIKNKTTSKNDPQNLLRSRKPDTAYHGLGLKNVRHIVERYNGTMNISIEDGFFTNKIILYGVQAKNDELPL